MKWIYCGITKDKEEIFTCVDDDDYEYLSKFSTFFNNQGVCLYYDYSDRKMKRIHRYCANAYLSDLVVHLNGNIYDNRKCNLMAIKRSESYLKEKLLYNLLTPEATIEEKRNAIAHRFITAYNNSKNLCANKKAKRVKNSKGETFCSVREAAQYYQIRESSIYMVISGHRKTHLGIKWELVNFDVNPSISK